MIMLRVPLFLWILTSLIPSATAAQDSAGVRLGAPLDPEGRAWVETTLSEMSVREMAAQLVLMWVPGGYASTESEEFRRLVERVESGVGGLWMMGGLPHDRSAKAAALQDVAKIPLFITTDRLAPAEGAWILGGGTELPPRIAFGAIGNAEAAREGCRIRAVENRASGSTVYFDGDPGTVALDPEGVLSARSYGSDPHRVAELTVACLEGYRAAGLLGTVGFFPGAGALQEDPHIRLPVLDVTRARLDSLEFVPYRAAIEAGVSGVMTSHFAVPALSGSADLPATLSQEIIGVLREDLGFQGLVLTDAFDMGALTEHYEHLDAVVQAFMAGHDILWAPDPLAAPDTIAALVEQGIIPRTRLEASVRRILEAKARLQLYERSWTPLEEVNEVVGRQEHRDFARSAADRSIVLLRDRDGLLPLSDPESAQLLSIALVRPETDLSGRGEPWLGSALDRILRPEVGNLESVRVSPDAGPEVYAGLVGRADEVDQVIIAVHLAPALGQDPYWVDLSDRFVAFVQALEARGRTPVLLSFGKQTVLDALPDLPTFMLAWSGAGVMQEAAARALLGRSDISGILPVALPPHHRVGDGLTRRRRH